MATIKPPVAVEVVFEEFKVDLLQLQSTKYFDGHSLANMRLDIRRDIIYGNLIATLHTMIPAENMKAETHKVTVEYPINCWNMFKEKYFPKWLQRYFPVEYKTKSETVTFTAYMLYPKFPKVLRGYSERQYIMKTVD